MDTWAMVHDERRDLVSLLETLTPEQWDAQTLCTEWRVRDVIGHIIRSIEAKPLSFLVGTVAAGFNPMRFNARDGRRRGEQPQDELLASFRSLADSRRHPPMLGAHEMLLDSVVHHQDIRRPLGLPRDVPQDRLRVVADKLKGTGFPLGTRKRIAGLRLVATDMDWSTGDGPDVSGTGEALVMMMAGRSSAIDDLSGEGKATLASRL